MNNITIINIFIVIILFYYLCFNCDDLNKENFRSKRSSSNRIIEKCDYCYSKLPKHTYECPYRYGKENDIRTNIYNNEHVVAPHGGDGGSPFLFICDRDGDRKNYINKLTIRSGSRIDAIIPTCNNGNTRKIGGNGGIEKNITLDNGFDSLKVKSGSEIDKIIINNDEFGGNGGSGPFAFSCSSGGKINGLYGRAGSRIDSLGVICTR